MSRRDARALILNYLFLREYSNDPNPPPWNTMAKASKLQLTTNDRRFAKEISEKILAQKEELDQKIQEKSPNWTLKRMAPIAKNILRIGFYELLYLDDIPAKVSIDEAIEIGRKYGDEETSAFVNGLMDELKKEIENEKK